MWNGLFMLLGLSMIMAISSFLAGSLPLSFSLSQRNLRFISALGSGVLIGTALIVIIPEGIETLYTAHSDPRSLSTRNVQWHGAGLPRAIVARTNNLEDAKQLERREDLIYVERSTENVADLTRRDAEPASRDEQEKDSPSAGEHHDESHGHEPHAWVGISLVLGFILMYLIDALPSVFASTPSRPLHISLSNLSSGLHHSPSHSPALYPVDAPPPPSSNPPATTIGLVIHAAADGIALGASSSTSSAKLGIIVFIAIMVHKAPAAFGLTSVLLKQGLSKRTARGHLLVFSLAAPVGALVTWIAVNMLGRETLGGEQGMQFATGCVLLFSGGTFLYVAMHSMQEAAGSASAHVAHSPHRSPLSNGYGGGDGGLLDSADARQAGGISGSDVAVQAIGMLVPLLAQIGHGGH
ncbi:ZIP metal ion transporter-like protein [Phyllosticta citricarpa]|uniref:ZIP metal ion transporter-like protein n=1 Tax=Phyllosticta citricarpa TaxID=55181 RepID=A0ABR1LBK7_9PEZI